MLTHHRRSSVTNPLQVQTLRRRRGPRGLSIFRVDHVPDRFGAVAAEADLDERADHDADHLPEEAAAGDADDQARGAVVDRTLVDGADGLLAAVAGLGEAGEVLRADE